MEDLCFKLISKLSIIFTILFVFSNAFAAGVVDRSFGVNGKVNINFGNQTTTTDVLIQPDGKIVVAGFVFPTGSNQDIFLARYNSNGSPDASFGNNGVTITNLSEVEIVNDIEIQPDGKIVAVGKIKSPDSPSDFLLLRYNQTGILDGTFGNGGVVIVNQDIGDSFNKAAIQADGKIIAVGGTAQTIDLLAATIRFNPNGTLDNNFGNGGLAFYTLPGYPNTHYYSYLLDVEILPDGRVLTGGTVLFPHAGNQDEIGYFVQVLRNDGSRDISFGTQGVFRKYIYTGAGWERRSFDAEVLPNGNILIADGTGVRILNLDGTEKYFPQDGDTATLMPNGKIIVGGGKFAGNFKTYSSESLIGTAWSLPAGKLAVQSDNKLVIAVSNAVETYLTRAEIVGSQGTRLADFDKDYRTDPAVYRASDKTLYVQTSSSQNFFRRVFSTNKSKIIPESPLFGTLPWVLYRDTVISWDNGAATNSQGFFNFQRYFGDAGFKATWGLSNDKAFGGDFNGDGFIDVGVFRQSEGVWYGLTDNFLDQRSEIIFWGASGDKPVPADYDYDGITDYAVYRPSTGKWWIRRSSDGGHFAVQFGTAEDIPLTGDFDGDGKADFTVYRPSSGSWYQLLTTEGFRAAQFGLSTDVPVPGDYDGDGKHDLAVYRNGVWYLLQSAEGFKALYWGTTGDVPVSVRYDN